MLARQPTARGVGLLADLLLQLLLLAVLFLRFGGCNLALLQCDAGQRTLKLDLPLLRDRVQVDTGCVRERGQPAPEESELVVARLVLGFATVLLTDFEHELADLIGAGGIQRQEKNRWMNSDSFSCG